MSIFSQKGPGVPRGMESQAEDANPSEQSGFNAQIAPPVWKQFVNNKAYQEANAGAIDAEQAQQREARRSSSATDPTAEVWGGSAGRLFRKVGRQTEEVNPEDAIDHPAAAPFARKALWEREISGAKSEASTYDLALQNPAFHARALPAKQREDMLAEGSMLAETDPRHAELKKKLVDADAYDAEKQSMAQKAWDAKARARMLESTDPETWWQNRGQTTAADQRAATIKSANSQHAEADAADQSAADEAAGIRAKLSQGMKGDDAVAAKARLAEIGQAQAKIAETKQSAAAQVGEVQQQAAAEVPQEGIGDFIRGAQVSLSQIPQLGYGVAGLIGATAEKFTGIGKGLKDWGLHGYEEATNKAQPLSRENDDIAKAWEKTKTGDIGALVDWAQYGIGYALGQMGETLAVSALGGIAGAAAGAETGPGAAVTGTVGAVAATVAKNEAKSLARKLIEKLVAKEALKLAEKQSAKLGAKKVAELAGSSAFKQQAAKSLGSNAAVMANALGMELGSIYPEAAKQAQSEGREMTGSDLARVWGMGIAAGGLEGLTDKLGIDLLKGKFASVLPANRLAAAAVGGLGDAAVEGGTELAQTFMERLGARQSVTGDEANSDYLNSAAMGALGGGTVGGIGGAWNSAAPEVKSQVADRINTALTAIDSQASPASEDEIAKAALLVHPTAGAQDMADTVLIERELAGVEQEDSASISAAEQAVVDATATGDKGAIKVAEEARDNLRPNRAETTRAVLKISTGSQLDDLTASELAAVGMEETKTGFKPIKDAPVMVRAGADGSLVLTDEALKAVAATSPRARARVRLSEAEAIQKAKERAAQPAAAEFDVPMRDGTNLRVKASDAAAALEEAAAQGPITGQPPTPVQSNVSQPQGQPEVQAEAPAPVQVPALPTGTPGAASPVDSGGKPAGAGPAKAEGKAPVAPNLGETGSNLGEAGNPATTGNPAPATPAKAKSPEIGKKALAATKARIAKAKKSPRIASVLIVSTDPAERAVARPDGTITINPERIIADAVKLGMNDEQAAEYFDRVLDEEIRHAAQYDAALTLWKESGKVDTFEAWREKHYGAIWQSEFAGTDKEATVRRLYTSDSESALAAWDVMTDGNKSLEAIRMMSQENVTEEAFSLWANIGDALRTALKAALSSLKKFTEAASPALQTEIKNLEDALKRLTATDKPRSGSPKADSAKPAKGGPRDDNAGGREPGGKAPSDGRTEPTGSTESSPPLAVGQRVEFTRNGESLSGVVSYVAPGGVRVDLDTPTSEGLPKVMIPAGADVKVIDAPSAVKGAKIDNEWSAFSKESGTLGIPRALMPQIHAGDRSALVQFLKARGIDYSSETVPADSLKPTQTEYSPAKVAKAKAFEGGNRSILISADNHVLDGHHQWMAALEKDEDIAVIRLDAPIRTLLPLALKMPSVETAGGEILDAPEPLSPQTTTPPTNGRQEKGKADAQGNVIPLSQRFNPTSDSILYAAEPPETTADLFKKRVPINQAMADEARLQQQAFGKNVASGKLAGFGNERSRKEQDITDALYEFNKAVKTNADAMAMARKRLAENPSDIEAKLLDAVTDKDFALDTADHLAMQMLINQRSEEAGNDLAKHADNMALRMAYRMMRGDVARALQIGYDRNMTPAERALAAITDAIYTPTKRIEKLAKGKPIAERGKFLHAAAEARVKQVEEELRKMGVTLGEITAKNNKLKLVNSDMMKQVAKLRKALDQDILKMVQNGASIADIKRRFGKEAAAQAQEITDKAREELRAKIAPMIAAGMTMEQIVAKMGALSAAEGPGSAKLTQAQIEAEIERVLSIGFGLPKVVPAAALPATRKPNAKAEMTQAETEAAETAAMEKVAKRWMEKLATSQSDTLSWGTKAQANINAMEALIREHVKTGVKDFRQKAEDLGATSQQSFVIDKEAIEERRRKELIKTTRRTQAQEKADAAEAARNTPETIAKRWIDKYAKSQSDTQAWGKGGKKADEVSKLIREHLKTPQADFIDRAIALGVTAEQARVLNGEITQERSILAQIKESRKIAAKVDVNPLTTDWARPQFTDGLNSYSFDTKDRAGIMSRVESIRALAGAMGKINTLTGEDQKKAVTLLAEIDGILSKYGTDANGIFSAAKPIEDYRFNIDDINHVSAVARSISAIDADWIDKASEVLYANMLSGLQTMAVNATGIVPAVWESTVGRGVEMAINLAVRDPMSAQLGEEKYILKALRPAISRAMSNFSSAYTSQHPMFDRDVLNKDIDWDKILGGAGYRTGGSISGKKGDIIRIPMRILAATDDFNRTLMACVEVGTFAYRIAKAQGMKPGTAEFDRFLKVQVNTPGSMSYELAAQKASRAIFSNALPGQKDNATGQAVPVNDIGDVAGWAAASLNKFASQQHDNLFAKAALAALRISFFPFQRTPFNILRKGIRYTLNPISLFDIGLGIVQNSRQTAADGTTSWKWNAKGRNPELVERAGQQLQGAMLMMLLAAAGAGEGDDDDQDKPLVITGSAPFTPQGRAEREAQMRSGIGPYRISFRRKNGTERFGFNYGRLDPLATTLAASIDLMKSIKRSQRSGKGAADAASEALGGFAAQAQDKSFMKGISDLVSLATNITAQPDLQDNRKFQQFLAGRVAMVIPNIIKQPIREADNVYRERSDSFMQELMYQAVPIGQKEAKVGPYGDEMVKTGNALGRTVDVTDAGTDKVNPVDSMLLRFRDKHPGQEWFPAPIVNAEYRHPGTGQNVKMTEAQLTEFRKLAGTRTEAILKRENVNLTNPTVLDVEKVKKAVTEARADMKKALAFKFSKS